MIPYVKIFKETTMEFYRYVCTEYQNKLNGIANSKLS